MQLFKVMVSVMGCPFVFEENVEEKDINSVFIEAEQAYPLDRVYVVPDGERELTADDIRSGVASILASLQRR